MDAQLEAYVVAPQRRFGDCYFGNWVVVDGKLYAVDLADSHYSDPYADLARYAYCQRFDHGQLQTMLEWYTAADVEPPSQEQRRRLRLHAVAQNLDYFGFFASLHGRTAPATKDLAGRLLADEGEEPACPLADLREIFAP